MEEAEGMGDDVAEDNLWREVRQRKDGMEETCIKVAQQSYYQCVNTDQSQQWLTQQELMITSKTNI